MMTMFYRQRALRATRVWRIYRYEKQKSPALPSTVRVSAFRSMLHPRLFTKSALVFTLAVGHVSVCTSHLPSTVSYLFLIMCFALVFFCAK